MQQPALLLILVSPTRAQVSWCQNPQYKHSSPQFCWFSPHFGFTNLPHLRHSDLFPVCPEEMAVSQCRSQVSCTPAAAELCPV